MRNSILILFMLVSPMVSLCQGNKPHIILIMTDQQRADALGCMGNEAMITPNLDGIAEEGVTFVNGYSSVPSCTPARAGLLTGLSPWHHGMLGYGRVATHYRYEMPQMLRDAGYYTFGIGKMHWFPQKTLHGFHGTLVDESGRVEQLGFVSDYRDWFKLHAPGEDPDKTGIGWNEHAAGVYSLEEELHPTSWTGRTAVDLIRNYDLSQPLFLKVSFARPHSPYDPPQRYLEMYQDAEIPGPYTGDWCHHLDSIQGGKNAYFSNFGEEHAVESRRHYYANITFIDDMVGEIIEALKDKEMYESAVICFTSDHGDMLGDHHHWRKTYPYEGSANIPFLLKWPDGMEGKLDRGEKLEQPVELRDFLPTFLDAAGVSIPEEMDGMSLLDLIRDPAAGWRPYIDLEHATCYSEENYWSALTDGSWKYIWFFRTGTEQLFNLEKDPGEEHDLSQNRKYRKTLKAWRGRMIDHLEERGDGFVKQGELVVREETMLYSPNYPQGYALEENAGKEWQCSFVTELQSLYNLGHLPSYRQESRNLQVSSYDRTGGNNDGFEGSYSYLRRNADSSLVIFECKGKGIIDRIWTPTPTDDTLDFYMGEEAAPRFSIRFSDLFSGAVYPFIQPLCGNEVGGFYSYVPIPFSQGCRIESRGKIMRFIQIQYRELGDRYQVKDFSMDLDSGEKEELNQAAAAWKGEGTLHLDDSEVHETEVLLKPGETVDIFKMGKGGRVLGIEIGKAGLFEGEQNNIDIVMEWDGEPFPAIHVPLADFFGYAFGKASMHSYVAGTRNNTNYFYLPMPFDQSARIALVSRDRKKTLQVPVRVWYSNEKRKRINEGKLYVQWNRLLKSEEGVPFPMAGVKGRGHYVGTLMQTQNLEPGMTLFFEGDDMAMVDGENTIHGTGSEDYFNGGWYAFLDTWDRAMSLPLHGSLGYSLTWGRTAAYRWHLNDRISFNSSLDYTMEHGPEGNREKVANTTLGFYYADTPKTDAGAPDNSLSRVLVPETFMLYPQVMDLNLWIRVGMQTEWCSPSGGYTYIFQVVDDSRIRVSLDEIPEGKYRLLMDYNELPEGCRVSFWQRQHRVSKLIDTHAEHKARMQARRVCDLELDDEKNTLTLRFETIGEKNSFSLNRLIFEKIEEQ
ncbi:MAG: arylsulfatase [Bacteroidota bacterium]